MEKKEIFNCISKFRKAIEDACSDDMLNFYPFYKFPDSCCDMSSELLAQFLLDIGIETIMINGESKAGEHHVWLVTTRGNKVIDITADQFNKRTDIGVISLPIIYGEPTLIHTYFNYNNQAEIPTCKNYEIYLK